MMGVVYRARDPELGRAIALKTVQLAWAISEQDRQAFEKRFMAEARVAANLAHPGIVVVHDVGRDAESNTVFIAMEYLQGHSLAEMTADRLLDWREALRVVARVAEALHHAHARHVVHRDIKPANIMVLPSGEPKIMDFGIAKVPASQLTTVGEFFGTPSYMSPEQAAGVAVDGRSDIFSLGSVLYLLLTGQRAFLADSVPAILARVSSQDPPAPSQLVPTLPPDADYLISRALAKDPQFRYPDGNSFAEDLWDIRDGRPPRHRPGWSPPARVESTVPMPAESIVEPETTDLWGVPRTATPHHPRAGRGLALAAALGFVAVIGLAVLLAPHGQPSKSSAPRPISGASPSAAATPDASTDSTSSLLPSFMTALRRVSHLQFTLEHPLKTGTLRIWIDDVLALEKPLESHVTRKAIVFKVRKGLARETLDVAPGDHVVKVQVKSGGFDETRRMRGTFKSGETRRLNASVGGILTKDLDVDWGS